MFPRSPNCVIRQPARACTICAALLVWVCAIDAPAENLPEIRPALVGSMKRSLVNLVDTHALMQKGVQHAAVLFTTSIRPSGSTYGCSVYGGTPGSDALGDEVRRQLRESVFLPAVYNHHYTYANFNGTVTFAVLEGKPHLRVYATQEKSELADGHDFISPQSIYITKHIYDHISYPAGSWDTEQRPATVEVELSVDAKGQIKDVRALGGNSADQKFADTALKRIRNCTFLPAFRNGRPVDSTVHYTFVFIPNNFMWKP